MAGGGIPGPIEDVHPAAAACDGWTNEMDMMEMRETASPVASASASALRTFTPVLIAQTLARAVPGGHDEIVMAWCRIRLVWARNS